MRPFREALSVRFVESLAGRVGNTPPSGLATARLDGSVAASAMRAVLARCRGVFDRLAGPCDALTHALAARPLLALAIALVAMPVARILLPPATGTAVATTAFGLALLALTLGWAARLHAEPTARRTVLRLVFVGALLRCAFAVLIAWRGGFPDETTTYFPLAADAAQSWSNGTASLLADHLYVANRATYFYGLGGAFFLTGPSLWTGRLLGAAIGLCGALAAGEVARSLAGRRAAVIAVGLLALHPEHAFWNATLSRDGVSTLLILSTLAVCMRVPGSLLRGRLLWTLPALGLLWWNSFLAAGWLGITVGSIALAECLSARHATAGPQLLTRVRQLAAVTLTVAALVWFGHRYGSFVSPETLSTVRTLGIGARADFLPDTVFTTWTDVFLHLPAGGLFVLGAPLPWNAVHAHRAAYALLAVGGWAITGIGLFGLVALVRERCRRVAPLLVLVVVSLGSLALFEGMDGIVVRHRLPLTAVLACCAAAWLASALPSNRERLSDPARAAA